MSSQRADEWRSRGDYFSWEPSEGGASPVQVFHVEMGDRDAPVLLLIHGWPTSSIDWFEVAHELSGRFRVCALDFPGYGFSDKPQGWGYSLVRDAELIEFYLSEVIGAHSSVAVGHDRGDSVALIHAARCSEGRSAVPLQHLVLSNANIFLPMSNLTGVQRRVLDPSTGPDLLAAATPEQMAEAVGASTFTPPRKTGDPELAALAVTFAHDDGVKILHETIQYLVERSKDEGKWLSSLAEAQFPRTLMWGLYDTVSPPRVAAYVWHEYLMLKGTGNRLYFIPDANHYLQCDRPDAFVEVLLHALEPADDQGPGPLKQELAAPLLVDTSRARLPSAANLLHAEAPA
jgi:pimeloyl-ACP methyl ester carboxylesterase